MNTAEIQSEFWESIVTALAERINGAINCYKTAKDILISLGYNEADLLKIKSATAWDFGRAVSIARYCAHAGYIGEGEAWSLIEESAQDAVKYYSDWRGYLAGYVFGRALGYSNDSPDMLPALDYLLNRSDSPFREVPFNG